MSIAVRGSLLLGLFVIVCLPGLAYARKSSTILSWFPEVTLSRNSQTMALLEAPHNSNPNPRGGGGTAIVDDSALSAGVEPEEFLDGGKSGNGQISVYIVRKGDSLGSIAKMFGVTTNTIFWANDIKSGRVVEGQELVILPVTGVRHIVKSGDTVKSITNKYKGDLEEVLSYNSLRADEKLKVGDIVIVPNGTINAVNTAVKYASATGRNIVGYFMRPIRGIKTQGLHGHNGIDFGAPVGTTIWAAAGGKVTVARNGGYNGGYGSYVVISHPNGTQTLYGHMNSVNVSVGQSVTQGQVIGTSGNTGKSTGPHLHFEVRGATNPF